MRHIAYICTDPGIPVWGAKGASIHVQEMLRALSRDARVTLLTPRTEGQPPVDLQGITVVPLPPAPKGDADRRARALLQSGEVVSDELQRLSPDLVYERHALYSHAAMTWAEAEACASVLEVNAPLMDEQATHRHLALPVEAEASVHLAMSSARLVTAVTPPVAQHARQMGARDTIVVPNAVDPARFSSAPFLAPGACATAPFTVGFLGSLKPWHGLPTLIDAFALLRAANPEARLLIVGDGPERAAVEARLDTVGVREASEITGLVPAARVPAELARMHVGTAPYGVIENFYFSPLKVYEYMAAALPVVSSDSGHLAEVIEHGRTGLIVTPGDASALAAALTKLAANPRQAQQMGTQGRAHVLAHHTWAQVAECVLTRVFSARGCAA